jgi:predicted polyphosphate/ATP-dependent NAD kinase
MEQSPVFWFITGAFCFQLLRFIASHLAFLSYKWELKAKLERGRALRQIPTVQADDIDREDIIVCAHQNEARDCGGMRVFVSDRYAETKLTPEILRELITNLEAALLHAATERKNPHFPPKQ